MSSVPGAWSKAADTDIPIGHLDYSYVKDCENAKELEEIIKILRSGKEGFYPDLVAFTEKKLQTLNPKSEVLHKENPALFANDLDPNDKEAINKEFLEWMDQRSDLEKESKKENDSESSRVLPPIRTKKTFTEKPNTEMIDKTSSKIKQVKPRDYSEWDKVDVEKELEKIDKKEDTKQLRNHVHKKPVVAQKISRDDLTEEERVFRATKEKEKGNEAYRAQDYEEAIVYYTNSLMLQPTAASFNNRAAAKLKVEKYLDTIEDCNQVLELEPKNIKAFLRRGLAFKALKQYTKAVENFTKILNIEPGNKRAKDLLEEIKSSSTHVVASSCNDVTSVNGPAKLKNKGQRLKIIEVENSDDVNEKGNVVSVDCNDNESGESHIDSYKCSGKEILEDLKIVNNDNKENEEVRMDNTSNDVMVDGLKDTKRLQSKDNITLEIPEDVKILMDKATANYKMGHYADALKIYSKCFDILWPEREKYTKAVSGLLNNKAACYYKMGDCKKCIQECNESLKLIHGNTKALIRRGTAYEAMEKYINAFHDFNSVRLRDSSNRMAQDHYIRVSKHLEMLYGKSWRSKVDNKTGDNILSNGQVYNDESKIKMDGASTIKDEESKKSKFLKLKESGNELVKKGKPEDAIKNYSECVTLCPDVVAIYTNRALCYLQVSKFELAAKDCDTALKIEPNNVKALYRRAKAKKGLRRYREASEDFVQVLKLDKKNLAAKNELTEVVNLLKKERKDENKKSDVPTRKKISIQDVEDDRDTHSTNKQVKTEKNFSKSVKEEEKEENKQSQTLNMKNKSTMKDRSSTNENNDQKKSKEEKENMKQKQSLLNVKTAFQFLQSWKSVKSPSEHLKILKRINLNDLTKVISNKLDGDMIKSILEALNFEMKANGDSKFIWEFLQKLVFVDRFDMTLMFLSVKEKQMLGNLFNFITENQRKVKDSKDLALLQKKYQL